MIGASPIVTSIAAHPPCATLHPGFQPPALPMADGRAFLTSHWPEFARGGGINNVNVPPLLPLQAQYTGSRRLQ